jgi:hypothetical protein
MFPYYYGFLRKVRTTDATTPLVKAPRALPESGTSGTRKAEQNNNVVSITEMLLNELITWKEMNDEESFEERQVLELRRRLTHSEEVLRFKGTAYNIAVFECDQLRSA